MVKELIIYAQFGNTKGNEEEKEEEKKEEQIVEGPNFFLRKFTLYRDNTRLESKTLIKW